MRADWVCTNAMRWDHPRLTRLLLATLLGLFCTHIAQAGPDHALQVSPLQVEEQTAATRFVINWSAPPPELKVEDTPGKPLTVSFAGSIPGLSGHPIRRSFSWSNLSGAYVENRQGRIQLFIRRAQIGTTSVKAGLNRLVIDVPHNYDRLTNARGIEPGVRHARFTESTGGGLSQVHVLEIDPHNPAVEIMPALAINRMGGKESVGRIVANHQAVAGINGSFFKPDTGVPLGIMMINQEMVSGPLYNRVALGISPNNDLIMEQVSLKGELLLPYGGRLSLHNVNQPRVRGNESVIYTSRWGHIAPPVPVGGMQIQLRNNQVTASSTQAPLAIPTDGMVISGPTTLEMLALRSLESDRHVVVNMYTLPDWSGMKHAMGGGPWLVRQGHTYVDMRSQHFSANSLGIREPRSAAGITKQGRLLLVTVDGRRPHVSAGMTLYELAQLMRNLGSVDAMNLDGGSSTQMAIYGQTVNRPSSGKVGVSNSLIVRRSQASSGVAIKSD